jgi:DNA ligase 1
MKCKVAFFLFLVEALYSQTPTLSQLSKYSDQNVTGWFMSEKLDGIRAFWDGEKLLSKKGNHIYAPSSFTINFPPFALDGELWSKRNDFEFIQSTVLDKVPSKGWRKIRYHIFEAPHSEGNFSLRLERVKTWFDKHRNLSVHLVEQSTCQGREDLDAYLQFIVNQKGEGVVLKDPSLSYRSGRGKYAFKVKPSWDMEGEVIALNKGKGKYREMMGSLTLKLESGVVFKLGGGFSKEERQNPPKVGSIVTFKYHGFTKKGKPKFASFLRLRKSE